MEKISNIRVKAQILVQVLWPPSPGPIELGLTSQGSLKSGQTRIEKSIVPYSTLSRSWRILFLNLDAVVALICMDHCLLATPGDAAHLAPLAGTFLMSPLCFRKKIESLRWKRIWPHLHKLNTAISSGVWSPVTNETTEDEPPDDDDQRVPNALDCFSTNSLEAVNHHNGIKWGPEYCYLQRWVSAPELMPPRIRVHCCRNSNRMEYENYSEVCS